MAMLAVAHNHSWRVYLFTGLLGVSFGLAFSATSALAVGAVPPDQTGVANGMNANIRTIDGSICSGAMAGIVTARLQPSGYPFRIG
jgi:hypothetical protein